MFKWDRNRRGRVVLGALTALLLLGLAPDAWAYHTDKSARTTETAHLLQSGEFRLGFWRSEYGVLDYLQLGTLNLPWAISAANGNVKARLYQNDTFTAAARAGWIRFDFGEFDQDGEATAVLDVVPVEGRLSYKYSDDIRLSAAMIYTSVGISGEGGDINGAVAMNTLAAELHTEWRLSKATLLFANAKVIPVQEIAGQGKVVVRPDEYTTIETYGDASSDALDFGNPWELIGGVAWSWSSFNLELSLHYGYFVTPVLGFVADTRVTWPDISMYWRF